MRALWVLAVGWWETPVVGNLAWALNVTVAFAPIGIKLINLVSTVLTLAEPRTFTNPDLFAVTIVGLPVAIRLVNRLPFVTSLYRFHG